eukprot:TRINITY_DN5262_c0_g1_i1.p1 TRINITY_DN5262_c0_g1~~TRINITY_DN5262_c0_g1_i1.p1  ORF type:complete len:917 (+),score=87.72 TRINITY_DN5262_c0_g1_i1:272-3022(+)
MERLLFAVAPIPICVILGWGVIAISGLENAAFYMLAICSISYSIFSLPLPASFSGKPQKHTTIKEKAEDDIPFSPSDVIQGRVEAAVHTAFFVAFPSLWHAVIYHRVLFDNWFHISNMMLLIGLPLVLLRVFAGKYNALWWTNFNSATTRKMLTVLSLAAGSVIVGCFEYRVIFHTFSHSIGISPPWSYVFVTLALYSIFTIFSLHFLGYDTIVTKEVLIGVGLLGSCAGGIGIGMPWYMVPISMVNGYALLSFYTTKRLRDYVLIVTSGLIIATWFMYKSFWFLNHFFVFRRLGVYPAISIQWMTTYLIVMVAMSLILPGLILLNKRSRALNGMLFFSHAIGFAYVESFLYYSGQELRNTTLYPGWVVLCTFALGCYLGRTLHQAKRITRIFAWVSVSLHVSRLSVFIMQPGIVLSTFFLITAVSALYYYAKEVKTMSTGQGLFYLLFTGAVTFLTRRFLPRALIMSYTGFPPSESVLISAALVLWGLSCLPLSFKFFVKQYPRLRNINVCVILLGVVVLVIQPEIGSGLFDSEFANPLMAHLNSIKRQMNGRNAGASVTSNLLQRWSLLVSVAFTILCVTRIVPFGKSFRVRGFYALFCGTTLGYYFAVAYIPYHTVLYAFVMVVFVAQLSFLIFTRFPVIRLDRMLPYLWIVCNALYLVLFYLPNLLLQSSSGSSFLGKEYRRSAHMAVAALWCTFNLVSAVLAKFELVAEKRQLESNASAKRAVSATLHSRDWIALVGNVSAALGVAIAVGVNLEYFGGSQFCIFFLAPLLLLLNRDPVLFVKLTDKNRYYPLAWTISGFLVVHVMWTMFVDMFIVRRVLYVGNEIPVLTIIFNTLLLLLTLPLLLYANQFLKDPFRKLTGRTKVLLLPLQILPIVFASYISINVLGLLAVAGGLLMYTSELQQTKKGLQRI